MPIEGISMTTVFSLVAVGIALALSTYIGGYYLRPIFDVDSLMASVAYDIAALYDLAYTLPGEVIIRYYGPSLCKWNYKLSSSSPSAFHCIDASTVIIKDVIIDKQYLLVYGDPYVSYDSKHIAENDLIRSMGSSNLADAISVRRPSFLNILIPFFNRQVSNQIDSDNQNIYYGSIATAPIAASYTDIDIMKDSETPRSVHVSDYSFIVSKKQVGNYYYTLSDSAVDPQELTTLIDKISQIYTQICNSNPESSKGFYSFNQFSKLPLISYNDLFSYDVNIDGIATSDKQDFFLKLYRGTKLSFQNSNISKLYESWSFDNGGYGDLGRLNVEANGAVLVDGLFIKAYEFKNNNYLKIPYNINLKKMSISVWFNPNKIEGDYKYILSNNKYNNDNVRGFGLRINPQRQLQFHLGNDITHVTLSSIETLMDNRWYHAVITFDNGEIKLYINGEFDSKLSSGITAVGNYYNLIMGIMADNSPSLYSFKGLIDDTKLFNDVLTPSEIFQLYSSVPGNYICQEKLSVSYDMYSVDNNLKLKLNFEPDEDYLKYNSLIKPLPNTNINGVFGKGAIFANKEYTVINYLPQLNKMSISLWIKPDFSKSAEYYYIISNNNNCCTDDVKGFSLRINPQRRLEFQIGKDKDNVFVLPSQIQLLSQNTYHVLITFNNGETKMYINGELENQNLSKIEIIQNSYNLTLGSLAFSAPTYFNYYGIIDELKIYDIILNEDEISYLNNNPGALSRNSFFDEIKINDYSTQYCFNIDLFTQRKPCDNIKKLAITQDFINILSSTNYYASWNSCIKPFLYYESETNKLFINASKADYNIIAGGCKDAK
ncbi:MAG: LamG domain-containing protein [Candidatus Nanoarchaeia archaeon]|nr:LamG domain-containing protein [Candidatus Nanoarchaeia archaeon]